MITPIPVPRSDVSHSLKLDLADGERWVIRPVDEEASVIVAELGKVMRLDPGKGGRELWAAVCRESARTDAEVGGAIVCYLVDAKQRPLASLSDRDMQVVQMDRIASLIAREALVQGGLLFHGALAEYQGSGFIMAGPSEIGKSTASRRLPLPWRSLCDDRALVVRDGKGRFWAHPWPTWSLFRDGGPGGSWAVEQAVPLRAVFFLDQSPSDQLEPIHTTQATALILESAVNLTREAARLTDVHAARTLSGEGLSAAKALVSAVPAFTLRLSLDGRFWEKIERVLPVGDLPGSIEESRDPVPVSVESLLAPDSLRLVCTGPSMNPTLRDSDLLEVRPYGTGRVHPGDVVCFTLPETDKTVVHRVVAVGPGGIRTRGDNNAADDSVVLQASDIIGRVKAAQRGTRRRIVLDGWRGLMVPHCARLGRGIQRSAGLFPHKLYCLLAGLGPFDRFLPASLRPRLVRFDARYRVFLKLLMGKQMVGYFDGRRDEWHIRRPFRLFVDERTLERRPPHEWPRGQLTDSDGQSTAPNSDEALRQALR